MSSGPSVDDRQGYIGGSDAAVVLGLSPWGSLTELFAQKKGYESAVPPDPERENLFYFGHLLEESIGSAFTNFYGLKVERLVDAEGRPRFFRSKKYPFMGGHIDFKLAGKRAFLECKNVRFASAAWLDMHEDPLEEDAADRIPPYYLAQVMHYMVLLECDYCYLAALVSGSILRVYRVNYNHAMAQTLIAAERNFWENHVLADDPPLGVTENDFLLLLKAGKLTQNPVRKVTLSKVQALQLSELASIRDQIAKLTKQAEKLREDAIVQAAGCAAQLFDEEGKLVCTVEQRKRKGVSVQRLKEDGLYDKYLSETPYFFIRSAGEKASAEKE